MGSLGLHLDQVDLFSLSVFSSLLSAPPLAFNSNDQTKGYDRFQVYNIDQDIETFTKQSQQDFGKFSKNKYPLQMWEPSDQADMEQ